MAVTGFFRVGGVVMAAAGVACGVVALVPAARAAVGCGTGSVCEPVLRSGAGITAVTLLMIGVIWFGVSFVGTGARKRAERLRRLGTAAPGEVLDIRSTGVVVNGVPRVEVTVRVDAPTGAFVVKDRMQMAHWSGIAVGSAVVVHYDPADPTDVVLDRMPSPAAGGPLR